MPLLSRPVKQVLFHRNFCQKFIIERVRCQSFTNNETNVYNVGLRAGPPRTGAIDVDTTPEVQVDKPKKKHEWLLT